MWNETKVIEQVNEYIQRDVFPAANFAVIEDEQVREFLFGHAQLVPEKIKLEAGKMWDLASVTKVVGTGTAMIDLVFSGQIDLEMPLKKMLPEFSNESLTIRQLLTHTSGIDPYIENRNQLTADELKKAILNISVTDDKRFKYTDINFILLGFLLEKFYDASLYEIFKREIFEKWQMSETGFGPVDNAVATAQNVPLGHVHDPKAQVLGVHCGAAGLFSSLNSLEKFVFGYFSDEKYLKLLDNYSNATKQRSLAWDILEKHKNWIIHTGYTGTFILMNVKEKKSVIFLSNRLHIIDERAKWIVERDALIEQIIAAF